MNASAQNLDPSTAASPQPASPQLASEAQVSVSSSAAKIMREQLARRGTPQAVIRFGIRGGGCTGFSYLFEFEDSPRANDHVIVKDGVRVVIDPKSLILLKGTEIHFETGIRGHGFRFRNPNVKDSCGCGESIEF